MNKSEIFTLHQLIFLLIGSFILGSSVAAAEGIKQTLEYGGIMILILLLFSGVFLIYNKLKSLKTKNQ